MTPGTHGVVQPWIPPTTGIPESLLIALEAHLFKKLVDFYYDSKLHEYLHPSPDAESEEDFSDADSAVEAYAEEYIIRKIQGRNQ